MNTTDMRRAACRIVAFAMAVLTIATLLLPLSGCAQSDWEGTWNRTGDATYSRAIMTITEAGGSDFVFSITMYNGNVAGEVKEMTARYNDSSKRSARCVIPETRAYIDFTLDEYGDVDVTYGYEVYYTNAVEYVEYALPDPRSFLSFFKDEYEKIIISYERQIPTETGIGLIESEIFEFEAPAYVTGHYTRGEVEYINSNLYYAGVLTAEEDERVRSLMTEKNYERLLDCFQIWKVSNGKENASTDSSYDPHSRKQRHEDEIGGYVFYGSNTMQEYAAVIIIYDDGTASVVVSLTDDAPVYYSSNAIYKDGSLTPLPIKNWLETYYKEQDKLKAAAEAKAQAEAEEAALYQ